MIIAVVLVVLILASIGGGLWYYFVYSAETTLGPVATTPPPGITNLPGGPDVVPGGRVPVDITDPGVQAAYAFLTQDPNNPPPPGTSAELLRATKQIVAGIVYTLTVKVTDPVSVTTLEIDIFQNLDDEYKKMDTRFVDLVFTGTGTITGTPKPTGRQPQPTIMPTNLITTKPPKPPKTTIAETTRPESSDPRHVYHLWVHNSLPEQRKAKQSKQCRVDMYGTKCGDGKTKRKFTARKNGVCPPCSADTGCEGETACAMKCGKLVDCPGERGWKASPEYTAWLAEYTTAKTKTPGATTNGFKQWDYTTSKDCVSGRECAMDFGALKSIKDFESWVIAFRTGGTKDEAHNDGFGLGTIDGRQVLTVTQSDTRDPGGSRRTEAKIAHLPVGDYQVTFDVHFTELPTFDTTLSQVKCGSGKPPINIKATSGGGLRVQSAGNSVAAAGAGTFLRGWNRVSFDLLNGSKSLMLSVNDKDIAIDNSKVETDCAKIPTAGPAYYLKIGTYEDAIPPGWSMAYGGISVQPLIAVSSKKGVK